jgi:hypothetical protein
VTSAIKPHDLQDTNALPVANLEDERHPSRRFAVQQDSSPDRQRGAEHLSEARRISRTTASHSQVEGALLDPAVFGEGLPYQHLITR